jgi:hypothetical protein
MRQSVPTEGQKAKLTVRGCDSRRVLQAEGGQASRQLGPLGWPSQHQHGETSQPSLGVHSKDQSYKVAKNF